MLNFRKKRIMLEFTKKETIDIESSSKVASACLLSPTLVECSESMCGNGELGEKGVEKKLECPDSIDLKENGKINETDADLKRKNELDYTAELNKLVSEDQKKRNGGLDDSILGQITLKEDDHVFEGSCHVVDLRLTSGATLPDDLDTPCDVDGKDNYHDEKATNIKLDTERPQCRISTIEASNNESDDENEMVDAFCSDFQKEKKEILDEIPESESEETVKDYGTGTCNNLDEKLPCVGLLLRVGRKSIFDEELSQKDLKLKVIPVPPGYFMRGLRFKNVEDDFSLDFFEKIVKGDERCHKKLTSLESRIIALRNVSWLPIHELPVPKVEIDVHYVDQFPPLIAIITQIAEGNTPRPQISMRYELLRLCTLRTFPRENKPYLIKLAAAGFYYASDGDGVVCYCCGIRRYGWTDRDDPTSVHKRINQHCKFFKKNAEYNVPAIAFGPIGLKEAFLDSIADCEVLNYSEDVNNSMDNNQSGQPSVTNRPGLGIQTLMPKHPQYATKIQRESSYNGWPNTSRHTPIELADAGFFFAGFGDCVRCFHCGIGLRHWDKDDNVWIEHARWSKDCVFLLQKKGGPFVELVQLCVQYTNELEDQTGATGLSNLEKYLVGDAAQFVLTQGFTPLQIKESLEAILSKDSNASINGEILLQKATELHGQKNETPSEDNTTPKGSESTPEATENRAGGKTSEAAVVDPKVIKEENEQLREQTVCKVCQDNSVSIVFLPCGHLVTCVDCAPAMRKCPICRADVKGTVRTYMS
ncbi:uncharacterized protein LOC128223991 [Mya arenaria]|uniref:uncharacterized protein LOC128223991 n=1 Tax=Mya arenaria TaxID=6604 RepID=UPI0022E8908B|nr:uncharacterized protein LOC128223991 [Mya arenaria]XP_052789515.1 uncharacterized protein LOC128223991 [Mya arenaria]